MGISEASGRALVRSRQETRQAMGVKRGDERLSRKDRTSGCTYHEWDARCSRRHSQVSFRDERLRTLLNLRIPSSR